MKRFTVLLAEDHSIVREGLRSLLELGSDFEVVGEAETGRQAVEDPIHATESWGLYKNRLLYM